jgi:hypothetical protein
MDSVSGFLLGVESMDSHCLNCIVYSCLGYGGQHVNRTVGYY